MNKQVKIIIQARMGSSRLPGKALKLIGGVPAIQRTIDRCLETGLETIVAYPLTDADKPLGQYLAKVPGIKFYGHLGPENDVAERFLRAAEKHKAWHIMRITGDCPFLDPDLMIQLVKLYQEGPYSYVSNVLPRSYPKGLDCEIFEWDALLRACMMGSEFDKEHVTPFIRREAMRLGTIAGLVSSVDMSEERLCLDTPEDLIALNSLELSKEP